MDYSAARKAMVDSQIRPNDVTDHTLLAAFETVPKEVFLPADQRAHAYVEKEIAYAEGRSLLTARDFAKLLQAMQIRPGDLALDVACGGGYSTAVLASAAGMVVAVESDETLAAKAEEALAGLEIGNAAVITGDLAAGAEKQGPFDVILIGAVIETAPDALFAQLKDGGRLGAVMLDDGVARGVVYHKSKDVLAKTVHFAASARHVLAPFEKAKEFVF